MVDESSCVNPQDEGEKIFSNIEEHVYEIFHKMVSLKVALENRFGPFMDFGGFNLDTGLAEKSEEIKDPENESKKELEKEQPSSSAITPQYLFKMEAKVDIKPYQSEIDVIKLNHWLQLLEVQFNVHNNDQKNIICLAKLRVPCTNLVGKPHGDIPL